MLPSTPYLLLRPTNVVVAAATPLSLDGTVSINNTGATTAVTLSTTKTNNIIVVIAAPNGGPITGVSGSTLGAFTFRSRSVATADGIELWWKLAASPLTNEVITVTPTISEFTSVFAAAINGAKTSSPFDVNGSLPFTHNGAGGDPAVVSTTAANTILLGGFRMGSVGTPTPGSGFTNIAPLSNGFALFEYQIVSAPQTSTNITLTTGVGDSNGSVADAIVQGP